MSRIARGAFFAGGTFSFRTLAAILIGVSVLGTSTAHARPREAPFPTGADPVALSPYLEVLEDVNGNLHIEDVRSPSYESRFSPAGSGTPNFGFTPSAFWARFRLQARESTDPSSLLLEIRAPNLDQIELFTPRDKGYVRRVAGDLFIWQAREIAHRSFVFRLPLEDQRGDAVYYLRITTQGALTIPAYLWQPAAFVAADLDSRMVYGMFYGLALALALYNLLLFFAIRDAAYLYYVLYAVSFGVGVAGLDGFAFQYLWPGSPWAANYGWLAIPFMTAVFAIQYIRLFLGTQVRTPWADRIMVLLILGALVFAFCSASGVFLEYRQLVRLANIVIFLYALVGLVVATRALLLGYRPARYFLFAWAANFLGLLIFSLRNYSVLPLNVFTVYSLHIGYALELLLLSFALGDRINTLKFERWRVRNIFGRYVSEEVVRLLVDDERRPDLAGETRVVTVLFADIRGFTAISEKLSAREVVEMLNAYFTRVTAPILAEGGLVDKYIGDAVMAVFGSPIAHADHAKRAVRAALGMKREAEQFREWISQRFPDRALGDFGIGIGLFTGEAVIGDIGTPKRKEFTVIGDTVNAASRLERLTKDLKIVIAASESTINDAGEDVVTGRTEMVTVKGRSSAIRVSEVLGLGPQQVPAQDVATVPEVGR